MRNHRLPLAFGLLFLAAGCVADAQNVLPPAAPDVQTNEQKAVAAIKKAWGKVDIRQGESHLSPSRVDFHNVRVAGETLDLLGALPNLHESEPLQHRPRRRRPGPPQDALAGLQTLNLCATHVTDAGLASLRNLPNLHALYLNDTQITDAGLQRSPACPSSRNWTCWARASPTTGWRTCKPCTVFRTCRSAAARSPTAAWRNLAGLHGLKELHLSRTGVTEAGIQDLQKALPQLRIIR